MTLNGVYDDAARPLPAYQPTLYPHVADCDLSEFKQRVIHPHSVVLFELFELACRTLQKYVERAELGKADLRAIRACVEARFMRHNLRYMQKVTRA